VVQYGIDTAVKSFLVLWQWTKWHISYDDLISDTQES